MTMLSSVSEKNLQRNAMRVRTASGISFSVLDPEPEDVRIVDIAHGLSNTCAWQGQTPAFYSLAEHAVLVASIVPEEYRLCALLHEAEKAYVGDYGLLTSHFRALNSLSVQILRCILQGLRIPSWDEDTWEHIQRAKVEVIQHERYLFHGTGKASEHIVNPKCLQPEEAQQLYLDLYCLCTGEKVPKRVFVAGEGGQRLATGLRMKGHQVVFHGDCNLERDIEDMRLCSVVVSFGEYAEAGLAMGKRVIVVGKSDISHPLIERVRYAREVRL